MIDWIFHCSLPNQHSFSNLGLISVFSILCILSIPLFKIWQEQQIIRLNRNRGHIQKLNNCRSYFLGRGGIGSCWWRVRVHNGHNCFMYVILVANQDKGAIT